MSEEITFQIFFSRLEDYKEQIEKGTLRNPPRMFHYISQYQRKTIYPMRFTHHS